LPPAAAAASDAAAAVKGDLLNPSYYPSRADAANVTKNWYIIDAKGQTLGRLATLVATYIRWECAPILENTCEQHRRIHSAAHSVKQGSTAQHSTGERWGLQQPWL
jgi:hypothetical protein